MEMGRAGRNGCPRPQPNTHDKPGGGRVQTKPTPIPEPKPQLISPVEITLRKVPLRRIVERGEPLLERGRVLHRRASRVNPSAELPNEIARHPAPPELFPFGRDGAAPHALLDLFVERETQAIGHTIETAEK